MDEMLILEALDELNKCKQGDMKHPRIDPLCSMHGEL